MIRTLSYSGRKVEKSSLANIRAGSKIWIDLHDPDERELNRINKLTGVYVNDMQNSLNSNILPRCVNRKQYSMVILRALNRKGGYTIIGLFVSSKYIVSVHSKKIYAVDELYGLLKGEHGNEFFSSGLPYMFCRIVSYITQKFHGELDKIEDILDKIEDNILDGKVEKPNKLYDLKTKSMNIRRSLMANKDVINIVSGGYSKFLQSKEKTIFSELKIELEQGVSVSEMLRERLTGAMDMYMSSVSNKLNDIMKGFTVIASLLLLPMLVSGLWGMNFAKIPFFEHGYGFFIPIGIMVVSVTIMGFWLKKKKWM